MAEREILLEHMLKVLKDIETNTCDKEFFPETGFLEKKLDRIIELHEKQTDLLKILAGDRCTCGKHTRKKEKKVKKEKKLKKEKQ
jgi:hypothetical protein